MSVNENAFYYNDKYYLLPADCANIEDLIRKHGDGKPFPAVCLKEKKCQAPYFISEYAKETNCRIKKGAAVFPCQVELLTRSAYDQRLLTVIKSHCPGCPNFYDGSVDGHHEGISLDGDCFDRDEAEDDSHDHAYVNVWIKNFVKAFSTLNLEKLIDKGKYAEAARKFSDALENTALVSASPVLAGKTEGGQYCLTFTSLMADRDALIMEHLFMLLSKKYGKTWAFLPGIPQNFKIRDKNCPPRTPPLGISFTYDEEAICKLSLQVYAREGEETGTYLWMCIHYGEVEFRSACGEFEMISVAEDQDLPENLLAPDDPSILKAMETFYETALFDAAYPPVYVRVTSDDPEPSETGDNIWIHTLRDYRLGNNFTIPYCHGERPYKLWDGDDMFSYMGFPVACVSFSSLPLDLTQPDTAESEACQRDLAILEKFDEKGLALKLAQGIHFGHLNVFFLVLNLREFLVEIRHMSPLFIRWPAELSVFTKSGKNGGRWKLNFEMNKLESEKQLLAGLIQNEDSSAS